jgi:hypothetical protein
MKWRSYADRCLLRCDSDLQINVFGSAEVINEWELSLLSQLRLQYV